jgi:hypothetical protein
MRLSFSLRAKRTTQAHSRTSGSRLRLGAVAAATLLGASAAVLAPAGVPAGAAPAGGTVGDPQPELAQFKVGSNSGLGSGVVLSNGNLVLAYASTSGNKLTVCVLHPGGRSCADIVTLSPQKGDDFFGVPEILSTGGAKLSVVAYDCCNSSPDDVFVYNSTDGGATFSAFVKAGTIGSVGAGTAAGGDLVVGTNEQGSLNVQAFPPNPASPVTSFATPNSKVDGDTSLTSYGGGVLVASDDLTNTYVEFAKSGGNFNASSAYKSVGTFKNQETTAVSENALLTDPGGSLTGGERLRFFKGSSFGSEFKVPDTKQGDDGYFEMQDAGGVAHVFFIGRRYGYDLFSETTSNGAKWSKLAQYASAIDSSQLVPVLGSSGAGVVLEAGSGSGKLLAQPILNPQDVRIKLAASTVKVGHSTKLTGSVKPHLKNQKVTLERKSGNRWYAVATGHESATGTFSFTVKTAETYRAVVAYKPGYYLYGYSNSVTLRTKH